MDELIVLIKVGQACQFLEIIIAQCFTRFGWLTRSVSCSSSYTSSIYLPRLRFPRMAPGAPLRAALCFLSIIVFAPFSISLSAYLSAFSYL